MYYNGFIEKFNRASFNEIAKTHPELLELKHTCLCGTYRDENDRDKDYELPKPRRYCKTCREDLEWRLKN